jgi:hypothetical protein
LKCCARSSGEPISLSEELIFISAASPKFPVSG